MITCIICRKDITNKAINEVKRVKNPEGTVGYVCTVHHGVDKLPEHETAA